MNLLHRLSISSYCVLRLPYVYSGEGGAHLPPHLPPADPLQAGFLKKGQSGQNCYAWSYLRINVKC